MKAPRHIGHYALEAMGALNNVAAVVYIAEVNPLSTAAVENHLAVLLTEFLKGQLNIKFVMLGNGVEHMKVIDVAPIPAPDRSFGQCQFVIGNH